MREVFKHDAVIRCMPNVPVAVRQGMLPYYCSQLVTEPQKMVRPQEYRGGGGGGLSSGVFFCGVFQLQVLGFLLCSLLMVTITADDKLSRGGLICMSIFFLIFCRPAQLMKEMLENMGLALELKKERQLDMATAVSGSSPAYFLLILEALVEAGVHIGLSRDVAFKLAMQSMLGTAIMAQGTNGDLATLKYSVTVCHQH